MYLFIHYKHQQQPYTYLSFYKTNIEIYTNTNFNNNKINKLSSIL